MKLEYLGCIYYVIPYRGQYENKTLAIVLKEQDGYPFCRVTVNIPYLGADYTHAYVDTNNYGDWIIDFILKNKLGKFTGRYGYSGYCEYPLYEFDISKISLLDSW